MLNIMQIRSIATSIVSLNLKRIGRAEESATEEEIDNMYCLVLNIFAQKEEYLKSLSAGR
jgi:hypothetical protein